MGCQGLGAQKPIDDLKTNGLGMDLKPQEFESMGPKSTFLG